ncbi:MAG: DUF362 domain-containing protein [Clostridium sp.]
MGCRAVRPHCAHDAITVTEDRKAAIDQDRCVGCGRCIAVCHTLTPSVNRRRARPCEDLNCKMAEYAKAVVDGRPLFPHQPGHRRVSQLRLPWGERRAHPARMWACSLPFDPVALDQACADACLGTDSDARVASWTSGCTERDFCAISTTTLSTPRRRHRVASAAWPTAEKIGMGSRRHELKPI